jgi:signal transduction histidine kinase
MPQTPDSHASPRQDEQLRLGKLSLEVSVALNGGETLREMLAACMEAIVRQLDAAFARIWLLNEEEGVLELQASSGMYTHLDGSHARIPLGAFKIGRIAAERAPHLTNAVMEDPQIGDREWARREGMVAFAGYPLLVGEHLIGVMALFARHMLNEPALQAMEAIANGIALGVERLRMYQSLQELNANLEATIARRTEDLNQLNKELERSNQELLDFAYVASHDLQEPLRKIQAFGNILEEEYGPALGNGKAYLERMRNAAARMRVLINDLLTFSRVTTKAQPFIPLDLMIIANEVVNDLEAQIQTTQGTVEINLLPQIEADPLQMRQMLQNLIGNALKFHQPGVPPLVRVHAEIHSEPAAQEEPVDQQCVLYVEDNGIGFDEKYLDRVFTVFQRLHGKGDYEGTGIGLAVVRKIVERHDGTITAHSTAGEGATFIVTLPVRHT